MLHIVLYQPEIPPNTGNIGRLCLATGSRLHLVAPLGFSLEEKQLRRAGMDYWEELDWKLWESWESYLEAHPITRKQRGHAGSFFLSSKAKTDLWAAEFADEDHLIFGPETRGLPETLLSDYPEQSLVIPMPGGGRSLNLATSAGIVVYEALRQIQGGL